MQNADSVPSLEGAYASDCLIPYKKHTPVQNAGTNLIDDYPN